MSNVILQINNLQKNYKEIKAVKGISIEVQKGQIYGILGPNGSGKTTTLAILLGILKASEGSFSWFGNGDADENRLRIGALLETPNFYPYLNAIDNLKIVARIKGVENEQEAILSALEQVDLISRAKSKFRTYSLGMKQRLAIAGALLSNPEVLVLDEPTNGLDPLGIADIRNLIKRIANEGRTVIIASHILDEMEKICTDVSIMRHGVILRQGPLKSIIDFNEHIIIRSKDLETIKSVLQPHILKVINENLEDLEFTSSMSSKEINEFLAQKGIYCDELYVRKQRLEQAFLEIIEA